MIYNFLSFLQYFPVNNRFALRCELISLFFSMDFGIVTLLKLFAKLFETLQTNTHTLSLVVMERTPQLYWILTTFVHFDFFISFGTCVMNIKQKIHARTQTHSHQKQSINSMTIL